MRRKPKVPPRPPRSSDSSRYSDSARYSDGRDPRYADSPRYSDDFENRSAPPPKSNPLAGALTWSTGALLAAVLIVGVGLGMFLSSATTSDVGNVATRYDIDRSAPNPEICVQFGASAISVDLRAFVTLNPFSVFISQPKMQPGCVLRSSNWEVLQSRNLVTSEDVNQCRRRMNTFGFTGDINDKAAKAQVDCIYQNDAARNLFLPQTGNNAAPPEVERFK
ncbi:MAG: DUF3172 domain-containing protein [Elainella sp. Prado103]|nr:DUF3172 domain-containing protein [Elainella sp. Prado103]